MTAGNQMFHSDDISDILGSVSQVKPVEFAISALSFEFYIYSVLNVTTIEGDERCLERAVLTHNNIHVEKMSCSVMLILHEHHLDTSSSFKHYRAVLCSLKGILCKGMRTENQLADRILAKMV